VAVHQPPISVSHQSAMYTFATVGVPAGKPTNTGYPYLTLTMTPKYITAFWCQHIFS